MKISALRNLAKINSNAFQNPCRLFSFKFEMTPASKLATEVEDAPKTETEEKKNFRYNVCQPRTSSVDRAFIAGDVVNVQRQTVKAAIDEQHLQPAMLPEFYQKQMEKNLLINPDAELTEEDRINKGHNANNQRRFQVSKTYANATLPLKNVKLASPFPEPVKTMMSRTVADDEKAEQMLAESRSQRNYSDWATRNPMPNSRSFSTNTVRWYSKTVNTNPDKCKKIGGPGKKGCPKLKVDNCPPRARARCDRLAKDMDCKKQEAPYPAYSEFCHEEIDEKPSECKMCPWKTEENPNFKPPKKHFHTSAAEWVKRSGLEIEEFETSGETIEVAEGMQCDMRKPDCVKPKNRRCPPTKEEKRKQEEEKRRKEKQKKCTEADEVEELLLADTGLELKQNKPGKGSHGPCKIKKFKFPKCEYPQREEQSDGRCRTKKRKPKVRDCPPCDTRICEGAEGALEELSLANDVKKDDKKCPQVDLTVNKDMIKDDDPCGLRRKGTTKICPGDLLKKKQRKPRRKKTSAPPLNQTGEMPGSQPTKTI